MGTSCRSRTGTQQARRLTVGAMQHLPSDIVGGGRHGTPEAVERLATASPTGSLRGRGQRRQLVRSIGMRWRWSTCRSRGLRPGHARAFLAEARITARDSGRTLESFRTASTASWSNRERRHAEAVPGSPPIAPRSCARAQRPRAGRDDPRSRDRPIAQSWLTLDSVVIPAFERAHRCRAGQEPTAAAQWKDPSSTTARPTRWRRAPCRGCAGHCHPYNKATARR